MDKDCIFCKIIAREIPAEIVFENDDVLAFRDIQPVAPVHILVIPKKHISDTMNVVASDCVLLGKIWQVIQQLAEKEKIKDTGFRVVINNGEQAGQAVSHLHFHLIGRRQMTWPPG